MAHLLFVDFNDEVKRVRDRVKGDLLQYIPDLSGCTIILRHQVVLYDKILCARLRGLTNNDKPSDSFANVVEETLDPAFTELPKDEDHWANDANPAVK